MAKFSLKFECIILVFIILMHFRHFVGPKTSGKTDEKVVMQNATGKTMKRGEVVNQQLLKAI